MCANLSVAGAAASPLGRRWLPKMLAAVTSEGAKFVVLKSLLARARRPTLQTHDGVVQRLQPCWVQGEVRRYRASVCRL